MPSKHMLPKGKRRQSVRAQYRAARTAETERQAQEQDDVRDQPAPLPEQVALPPEQPQQAPPPPEIQFAAGTRSFTADPAAAGKRLDAYLAQVFPEISRSRVQLLVEAGQVLVDGASEKASLKLRGGERIEIAGDPRPEPLHASPEAIPLDILYEDQYLAIVNKPAGMMVHAGAGVTDDARNRGTLVNALLHHMGSLSTAGGEVRPGIVHRLDKLTSGAIVVAKDDLSHRKLSEMFASRHIHKTYTALVHGTIAREDTTVDLPIARDLVRRTRMTTRRAEGRSAVSHIHVRERITTPYGAFTLVEVRIETGRTHQIRVHLQSLGHPVVGDTLYGAPRQIVQSEHPTERMQLGRNFLHAAHLEFAHPKTGWPISIDAPLPAELTEFLGKLRAERAALR